VVNRRDEESIKLDLNEVVVTDLIFLASAYVGIRTHHIE